MLVLEITEHERVADMDELAEMVAAHPLGGRVAGAGRLW